MSDLVERIHKIIRRPQLTAFATVIEAGKPWVRYVMAIGQKDMTIRFATHIKARKVGQIRNNPHVHLTCGVTEPIAGEPYLQIAGTAGMTTDSEVKEDFWFPMLNRVFSGPNDPNYGVIRVSPSHIEYCTPGRTEPEVWKANGTAAS